MTKKPAKLALSKEDKALFTAAKRKSIKSLDAALDAGADLTARDEQGFTALHLVAREHELPLALHLVSRGADPWAGSYGPADGFRPIHFFDPGEAKQLAAAAARRGIVAPEAHRLSVLTTLPERRVVTFEAHPTLPDAPDATELRKALRAGTPAAPLWPAAASLSPSKFRDPADVELRDLLLGGPTGFLVSAALAEHLTSWRAGALTTGEAGAIELLPVALLDDAGAPRESRFALHVLSVPALDLSRAFPKHNLINHATIDDVAAHALLPAATDKLHLFRAAEHPKPVFLSRELTNALSRFTGVSTFSLRR